MLGSGVMNEDRKLRQSLSTLNAELPRKIAAEKLRSLCGPLVTLGLVACEICGISVPKLEAAENYWVAGDHPNASDSNDGLSFVRPFKTLNRAVQELSPGDTLFIKAGIYREALVIGRSGTANSPIVIRAYPGDEGNVVIRGSDVVKGWTNDGGDVWSVPGSRCL